MATIEPRHVDTDMLNRILGRTRQARTAPAISNRVLVWHDAWRNADRVLRWRGPCLGCGVQTWAFDDGENDPRGVLGDAALWPVDMPNGEDVELDVRACPTCANDYDAYKHVQRVALMIGYDAARPYQPHGV